MLDEFLEYRQYSYDFSNDDFDFDRYRLSERELKHGLSGLSRALETVARFELFHGNRENLFQKRNSPLDHSTVTDCLSKWVMKWLKDYAEILYKNDGSKNKNNRAVALINSINGANARWSKDDLFKCDSGSNTFNEISYNRIVARALDKGPLHKYILVEERDFFGQVAISDNKSTQKKKLSDKQKDYILKLTAFYLIENKLNQKSVLLSDVNLINWWINSSHNPNSFYLKETELFEKPGSEIGNNFSKYMMNSDWIKNYSLLDVTDEIGFEKWLSDSKNKGRVYYEDQGANRLLKRHVVSES